MSGIVPTLRVMRHSIPTAFTQITDKCLLVVVHIYTRLDHREVAERHPRRIDLLAPAQRVDQARNIVGHGEVPVRRNETFGPCCSGLLRPQLVAQRTADRVNHAYRLSGYVMSRCAGEGAQRPPTAKRHDRPLSPLLTTSCLEYALF